MEIVFQVDVDKKAHTEKLNAKVKSLYGAHKKFQICNLMFLGTARFNNLMK